jgi:hypothetical protein
MLLQYINERNKMPKVTKMKKFLKQIKKEQLNQPEIRIKYIVMQLQTTMDEKGISFGILIPFIVEGSNRYDAIRQLCIHPKSRGFFGKQYTELFVIDSEDIECYDLQENIYNWAVTLIDPYDTELSISFAKHVVENFKRKYKDREITQLDYVDKDKFHAYYLKEEKEKSNETELITPEKKENPNTIKPDPSKKFYN